MEKKNNVEEILEKFLKENKVVLHKGNIPSEFKKLEVPGIGTIWVHKLNF